MSLTNGQLPLYASAGSGSHQQLFGGLGGGGGGLPDGAIAGVDFTAGVGYIDGEEVSDLTSLFGGLELAEITASGAAILPGNSNRPDAIGDMLTLLTGLEYCIVVEWDQLSITGDHIVLRVQGTLGEEARIHFDLSESLYSCDYNLGNFFTIGTVLASARNRVAASNNADGWLSSLNGSAAVLDAPQTVDSMVLAHLGHTNTTKAINGNIRWFLLYPTTDAAGVQALSAL